MGSDLLTLSISVRVSRHNSWRDDRDDAALRGLCQELLTVLSKPDFACLSPLPDFEGDPTHLL